jgi:hypothetical protein
MLVDATGRDISTSQAQQAASPALSPLQTFFVNITGIQPPPPPQPQEAAPSVSPNPPRRPQAHLANANRPDHHARTEQKSDGHATKRELTKPERDALFQDFLRWHESQQITGAALPASRRQ